MSPDLIAISARHLERLLIVIAGGLSIVLGYRMFLAIPRAGNDSGEGKLELPGGISVFVTRVGPGVFFALFGAMVLGLGLHHGLRLEKVSSSDSRSGTSVVKSHYSSLDMAGASAEQRVAERTSVLDTVTQMSRLAAALAAAGSGGGFSEQQRLDFDRALDGARTRLLASVWDHESWGSHTEFVRWVEGDQIGPPPSKAAPAVRAYRGGR